MSRALALNIPRDAIVLPSNVNFQFSGKDLVLQKVKRRVRRFKTTKEQRTRMRAAAKKFKWPILTTITFAPAVTMSLQKALLLRGIMAQIAEFARNMISFYTGVLVTPAGTFDFKAERLLIGWGPIVAVGGVKLLAKGRIMALNRALSRAQIPASVT